MKINRSWYIVEKLSHIIFWKSFFLKTSKNCTKYTHFKKHFSKKSMWLSFSTLYHDLFIFITCCNYFLCSLDPGKSIGNNYSITRPTKNILTQEKGIFSIWSKSNVDEAQIYVEISTLFDEILAETFFQLYPENFLYVLWTRCNVLKTPFRPVLHAGKKIMIVRHTNQKIFPKNRWGGNHRLWTS